MLQHEHVGNAVYYHALVRPVQLSFRHRQFAPEMAPVMRKCLSCLFESAMTVSAQPRTSRAISTLPRKDFAKRARRAAAQSKSTSVTATDMGLIEGRQGEVEALSSNLKPYSPLELKLLQMKYTPEQIDAIKAGEESVDAQDMIRQGRFRTDPMRIDYIDDFATLRPGVDRIPADVEVPRTPKRNASSDDKSKDGKPEASAVNDQQMLRLSQQTGLAVEEIRRLRTKMLVTHRVVNQTRMGKIQSLYFLTVAGNGDGMLGIGEGKAAEDEDGRRQAMMNAIRNMKPVPRYEGRTIFGESEAKVGATIVQLSTRPPGKCLPNSPYPVLSTLNWTNILAGFGNRCQHLIFELARAAGISDLAARTPRSRNKMNVVKAAFAALTNQRLPEDIAQARGRKMVDVRNVYYGGLVH